MFAGGWAILVALYESSLSDDFVGYLTKSQLIAKATPYCDASFQVLTN
jgi:hypothetical protein